jgi:hypothetical protein
MLLLDEIVNGMIDNMKSSIRPDPSHIIPTVASSSTIKLRYLCIYVSIDLIKRDDI